MLLMFDNNYELSPFMSDLWDNVLCDEIQIVYIIRLPSQIFCRWFGARLFDFFFYAIENAEKYCSEKQIL